MTVSHPSHNYNRRNSFTAPYSIPNKYNTGQPHDTGALASPQSANSQATKLSRNFVSRRISEGETGRLKEELKCETCGKGYRHISSLAKHLWEHTPEWNVTKKLLLSKHQQVQLLEAASILVGMHEPSLPQYHLQSRRSLVFHPISEGDDLFEVFEDTLRGRRESVSLHPPFDRDQYARKGLVAEPASRKQVLYSGMGYLDTPNRQQTAAEAGAELKSPILASSPHLSPQLDIASPSLLGSNSTSPKLDDN